MTALGRIAFCIAFLVAAIFPIHAQDTALQVGSTVDGSLSAGETHRYSFVALEFTLVSFRVEALAGELDPVLEVFDSSGDLIVSNDDYDYPDSRDAALQAFVFPQTGTYTVAVSAFGESGGDYRLHLLPGYDKLALHDKTMKPFQLGGGLQRRACQSVRIKCFRRGYARLGAFRGSARLASSHRTRALLRSYFRAS